MCRLALVSARGFVPSIFSSAINQNKLRLLQPRYVPDGSILTIPKSPQRPVNLSQVVFLRIFFLEEEIGWKTEKDSENSNERRAWALEKTKRKNTKSRQHINKLSYREARQSQIISRLTAQLKNSGHGQNRENT